MARLTRRSFVGGSGAALALARTGFARRKDRNACSRLRYTRHARNWDEALPIGNGRLGAMVFGRIAQERLQLNEDTLWAGSPYSADNPDALAAIPEIRRLIADGQYAEATALASRQAMATPLQQMAYGSLGDLLIDIDGAGEPGSYERVLDLDTAISSVHFSTSAGRFSREAFASAADDVIVWRMECSHRLKNVSLFYRSPRAVKYTSPVYQGPATHIASEADVGWLAREELEPGAIPTAAAADGDGALLITGKNWPGPGVAAGLTFALRLVVIADGQVTVQSDRVAVRNAREITLLISAATSFVDYRTVDADPVDKVRRVSNAARRRNFTELRREHVRTYRTLYRGASLSLESTPASDQPTDIRIASAETSRDPALAALYFQFARYLLISSSRPGCQPANLQGIWNEGINPPWQSKYTININTEMNYWPADAAGLSACVEPLLRMVEELARTGAKTARAMYGARGWVAHHNTDLWRAAAPIDGPIWGLWPCGGAWLCVALWNHYDYTRDRETLARLYPLMLGASRFFLDTLVPDTKGRGLITSPSLSPENVHPFGSSLCAGPAMDRQILRDLFEHTIEASNLLGQDPSMRAELEQARRRLAPDRIGKSGQWQEWLEDWDDEAPEQNHRHVSHLYAIYPSSQANVRDTPALIDAAKVSLRKRGDLATGWGTAWRLCLWARMGDGEHAHAILTGLLGPKRTYPNLFDAHPPFQIDGNFGGAAGILEMVVQSWGGELRLLPALPKAWGSGSVRGIRARGDISLDMEWRSHEVQSLKLSGPKGARVRVLIAGKPMDIELGGRGGFRYTRRNPRTSRNSLNTLQT